MSGVLPLGRHYDIQKEIVEAYKKLRSFAGIAKPLGTTVFTVEEISV